MPYNLVNSAGILIPPQLRGYLFGKQTIITNTSGVTFTPDRFTKLIFIRAVGGGGAGRACINSSAGQIVLGGGGGSGGYAELTLPIIPVGLTVTAGAGGLGSASGGGSNSTVNLIKGSYDPAGTPVQGLLVASGGASGASISTGTTQTFSAPSNAGTSQSLVGMAGHTRIGGVAYRDSGTVAKSGKGTDSALGAGGASIIAHGNGNPGLGFGSGGSGGMSVNAAGATNGGNGANGIVIIWEFF